MTVAPVSSIPISVDYTSKDYYALRDELIARVKDRIGTSWTASDPADFGVALVEAFAYLGDLLAYYIDRNANESYINTATQRSSILNIAQNYGYVPAGYRQAITTVTFANNQLTQQVIPAGTVLSGELVIGDTVRTIYFTTILDVTVPAKSGDTPGSVSTFVFHGRTIALVDIDNSNEYGEKIGESVGLPNMSFTLGKSPVADGTIEVYVQDGDIYSKWTEVQHILDSNSTDLVFTTYLDENDIVTITFGDGVSGVIPTLHSSIRARYTVGGGDIGNIPVNTLTKISYVPGLSENALTSLQSYISITNTVGLGGSDPETNDEIRTNAPLTLRTNKRAVTLQDYADLALSVPGVGKSNATSLIWTSVTVYISPSRAVTSVDTAPGYSADGITPSQEYETIKSNVVSYLSDKILLGTTVTVQPPTYVDLSLAILYTKLTQYTAAEVENNIKLKLLSEFGYTRMYFGDTIYTKDIEFVLAQVPGVKVAEVVLLKKYGLSVTSASGSGTAITYTLNNNPSMAVGSKVTVTGLTPSGYNVTNTTVTAVGTNTITVAGTQTGSSSGTGSLSGLCIMQGQPGEIFRFSESNTTITPNS